MMMRQTIIILLLTLALYVATPAQSKAKNKLAELPANLAKMEDEYPDDFLADAAVKSRLQSLLGDKYTAFFDSFETKSQFEKKGNFLFSHGCLIHACTHLESAMVIDLVNKTIHIGIFHEGEIAKVYNEDNKKSPKILVGWLKNLKAKK